MSDTITFTSAVLESFSRSGSGGRAKFSAALTDKVRSALGWTGEIPDYFTGGTPEADLHAVEAELVPNEKQLHKHRVGLSIQQVHRFELVRLELEGKKGKGHRLELRFDVKFGDTRGCEKLEKYMQTIGEGKGSLTVTYTPQQDLDLAGDERRQATMADND
jgi:hypothetical protein